MKLRLISLLLLAGLLQAVRTAAVSRTRRCSCSSFLDNECIYFCHLDIIWVTTPQRTLSYGLGATPREKRSAALTHAGGRCRCSGPEDHACHMWCYGRNKTVM